MWIKNVSQFNNPIEVALNAANGVFIYSVYLQEIYFGRFVFILFLFSDKLQRTLRNTAGNTLLNICFWFNHCVGKLIWPISSVG